MSDLPVTWANACGMILSHAASIQKLWVGRKYDLQQEFFWRTFQMILNWITFIVFHSG